ncbi:S8 family serine peptidase [Pedobacter paludis]|uniref:Peptidase S8 n=1 Tax=Pedobacter paludis TaxID=2203212 RepID=A0A317EY38_9SPHI|nr:S8 family serine peptidase [Pedobacter paludis]PWS30146.1 peptidase S8 [Pedobacter paludis]
MKKISRLFLVLLLPLCLNAQQKVGFTAAKKKELFTNHPQNWHLLSIEKDSVYGTEVNRAYTEILKGKTAKKVVVAIIDAGVDINHEDLKSVIWTNHKEIPGNGIDDDHNGYIDDVHGWNFLGSADGKTNIEFATSEDDREFVRLSKLYEHVDTTKLNVSDKKYLNQIKRKSALAQSIRALGNAEELASKIDSVDRFLKKTFPNKIITVQDLYDTKPEFTEDKQMVLLYEILKMRAQALKYNPNLPVNLVYKFGDFTIDAAKKNLQQQYISSLKDNREIIMAGLKPGQNWGNGQLNFKNSDHGTHVAGAIGADRTNKIGIEGIAGDVEIMPIRVVVPQGDEYDEDVAKAIRYAVDNGATLINMSFGKRVSPHKALVDEAIEYAEKKDVLIVRGGGNFTENADQFVFYPSQFYNNGKKAGNVITVGATSPAGEIMGFSNFGKKSIDLFAPGFDVYSTEMNNKYSGMHGTSMASPVVCGIAALIRSYYPKLSAPEVKNILMQTVTVIPVELQGKLKLQDLSVSGGIVNAYQALKLADTQSKQTK